MIDYLILAAGSSKRFGSCKSLFYFANEPWIFFHLKNTKYNQKIVVVAGFFYQEIYEKVSSHFPHIQIIHHQDWEEGVTSSLLKGLESLSLQNPIFVIPVDTPFIPFSFWPVHKLPSLGYIKPEYGGKGGHPLLFSPHLARQILQDKPLRLDAYLKNKEKETFHFLQTCLLNFNTPDSFELFEDILYKKFGFIKKYFKENISLKEDFRHFFLYGKRNEGKTTAALNFSLSLKEKGFYVGGFLQIKVPQNEGMWGYHLLDLFTGETHPFILRKKDHYEFSPLGWEEAEKIFKRDYSFCDFFFCDECGTKELEGKGHFLSIEKHLNVSVKTKVIYITQEDILKSFMQKIALFFYQQSS